MSIAPRPEETHSSQGKEGMELHSLSCYSVPGLILCVFIYVMSSENFGSDLATKAKGREILSLHREQTV